MRKFGMYGSTIVGPSEWLTSILRVRVSSLFLPCSSAPAMSASAQNFKSPLALRPTNSVNPGGHDRPQTMLLLEQIKQDLAALDAKLAPQLERRSELVHILASLEELVHPIRRLSTDLLQEIFMACLPDGHLPTLTVGEAPLLLTQVCRDWGELAKATPQLWTTIHLPVCPDDYRLECGAISLVQSWFSAARYAPMSVSLWSASHNLADKSAITTCVSSHSFHIRTLELHISAQVLAQFQNISTPPPGDSNSDAIMDSSCPALPGCMWPVLEEVTFRLARDRGPSSVPGEKVSKARFWSAPRLKNIFLASTEEHIFALPLNWNLWKAGVVRS